MGVALAVKLAGIELMHMIRKGQLLLEGCSVLSFADQFDALARQDKSVPLEEWGFVPAPNTFINR